MPYVPVAPPIGQFVMWCRRRTNVDPPAATDRVGAAAAVVADPERRVSSGPRSTAAIRRSSAPRCLSSEYGGTASSQRWNGACRHLASSSETDSDDDSDHDSDDELLFVHRVVPQNRTVDTK